jgi:hypothetical protein
MKKLGRLVCKREEVDQHPLICCPNVDLQLCEYLAVISVFHVGCAMKKLKPCSAVKLQILVRRQQCLSSHS